MTPANPAAPEQLPQPFQRYRTDNLLLNQILSELFQRPDAHTDKSLGRREGHLTYLFHNVSQEFSRPISSTIIRIPANGLDPSLIKSVNDLANPGWCTTTVFGNLAIGTSAARQQNNSCMTAVDSVGQLLFHTFEFSAFPRLELPCHNFVGEERADKDETADQNASKTT